MEVISLGEEGRPVSAPITKFERFYFNESVVRLLRGGGEKSSEEAMLRLIQDQGLRELLVQNAGRFAINFDWTKKSAEYLALVDSLVDRETRQQSEFILNQGANQEQ